MPVQVNERRHHDASGLLVSVDTLRAVMARVATPVSVVTTTTHDGRPHGTTVSAFMSLSFDPPMLVVSLARSSTLLTEVVNTGRFAVNILAGRQSEVATVFATKRGSSKFDGVEYSLSSGLPRLSGSLAWLSCDVADTYPGGDHVIIVAHIRDADVCAETPLTYHDRTFGTHTPH